MSARMKLALALVVGLVLTLSVSRADRPTPEPIPAPNRVEVISLEAPAGTAPSALSRKRGRTLVAQINRLKWLEPARNCDKAQYELRFYAGGKILADRLICFHCGCFAPAENDPHPDAPILTFDPKSANSLRLQKSIEQLFPASK